MWRADWPWTASPPHAEDHEHVFDPFWQKDPSQRNTAGSSGLGLSVARQLARLLGGDVEIASSVIGVGSTLVVSLPARYVEGDTDRRYREPSDRRI